MGEDISLLYLLESFLLPEDVFRFLKEVHEREHLGSFHDDYSFAGLSKPKSITAREWLTIVC